MTLLPNLPLTSLTTHDFSARRQSHLRSSVPLITTLSRTLASLLRFTTKKSIANLISSFNESALADRDLDASSSSRALAILSLAIAQSRSSALFGDLLVATYIGRFEPDKAVAKSFESAWTEFGFTLAGGAEAIVPAVVSGLGMSAWSRRKQAAAAAEHIARNLGSKLNDVAPALLDAALAALGGRYWTGKESILPTVAALVKAAQGLYVGLTCNGVS